MTAAELAAARGTADEESAIARVVNHRDRIVGDEYAAALARALATEPAR